MEPVVDIIIDGTKSVTYGNMSAEKVKKVVAEHIVNGNPVNDFIISTD
jgi:NADP-reducing hydrogenase subunit HndB